MLSPFKFLDSYTKADRDIFFGRENEIEELYTKIFKSKLLLVYGPSGTGKTSLIQCGLGNKFQDSDWLPLFIRRGSNINESLASTIAGASITELNSGSKLTKHINSLFLDHFKPVYLIFDQFEELFIFGGEEERNNFIDSITELAASNLQYKMIFIIRGEYLEHLSDFEYKIQGFFDNRIRIEKMTQKNAKACILGPCQVFNIKMEDGFPEKLLEKLAPGKPEIELTYLQVFMDKLFKLASTGGGEKTQIQITGVHLDKIGRISDVLSDFLEEQIASMAESENALIILKAFVSAEGTKRQLDIEEINEFIQTLGKNFPHEIIEHIVQQLVNLRILRDRDEQDKYELRHDALAAKIYEKITLAEKELLEVRQMIANRFKEYESRNILLSADDLNYVAPYERKLFFKGRTAEFVQTSKNYVVRKRKQRRVVLSTAVVLLLLFFSGLTYWALQERNKARVEKDKAGNIARIAKSDQLATMAMLRLKDDPTLSFRLAERAYQLNQGMLPLRALTDSYNSPPFYNQLEISGLMDVFFLTDRRMMSAKDSLGIIFDMDGKVLNYLKHDTMVYRICVSPDSTIIATGDAMGTIKIWDVKGTLQRTLLGHSGSIFSLSFSHDGQSMVSASKDSTTIIWNIEGEQLMVMKDHDIRILGVEFTFNDDFIVLNTLDRIYIWKTKTGKPHYKIDLDNIRGFSKMILSPNSNHLVTQVHTQSNDTSVYLVLDIGKKTEHIIYEKSGFGSIGYFSPNGKNFSTHNQRDQSATIWDLNGKKVRTYNGIPSPGLAQFSPEGDLFLTVSYENKEAQLWNVEGMKICTLGGHDGGLGEWTTFSPYGKYIATGGWFNSAKIWDYEGNEICELKGHSGVLSKIKFTPDNKHIITFSEDKKTKIWKIPETNLVLRLHQDELLSAKYSQDGKFIITTSYDSSAILWTSSCKYVQTFEHNGSVYRADFSNDSKYLFTLGGDSVAKIWDITKHEVIFEVKVNKISTLYRFNTMPVNISPDFEYVGIANLDHSATIFRITGEKVISLIGHNNNINSLHFSPNGKLICTTAEDSTCRIWNLEGKNILVIQEGKHVNRGFFSPDGKKIALLSLFRDPSIWNLEGKKIFTFRGEAMAYNSSLAFSKDGKYILINSNRNTASLWDSSGLFIKTLEGHSGNTPTGIFSPDSKYILTSGYDKTARLWDIKGEMLQVFKGHKRELNSAEFSPDGKYILTASQDSTARIWPFAPEEMFRLVNEEKRYGTVRQFTQEEIQEYGISE